MTRKLISIFTLKKVVFVLLCALNSFALIAQDDCFTPLSAAKNLAPDPTYSDASAMRGWGSRSINTTQDGRCGNSCGSIQGGSYDQLILWQPNTMYKVRALIHANGTNAQLGVYGIGKSDMTKQPTNKNQWELVELEFETGNKPTTIGGVFFNGGTDAYIDNLEVYIVADLAFTASSKTLSNNEVFYGTSLVNQTVTLQDKAQLYLYNKTQPISGTSMVNLTSEDCWLIFEDIRPSSVIENLLPYIQVNGEPAVNETNVRVAIYKHGTVVMAHSAAYQPLTVYTGQNYEGESNQYGVGYYSSLGNFDNAIRSFKLKKGYAVTFANQSDGGGYSRVFIGNDEDVEFSALSEYLDETVSFIRVVKWEWVSKKGWCGGPGSEIDGTWYYDWNIGGNTTSSIEYATIKQNGGWPSDSSIKTKTNVSHLLGYNEPDRPDQSNMTLEQVISGWPSLMKLGYRLGSPAYSSEWNGLFSFIDQADALNYRVDFVAIHCYWGGRSPQAWYDALKYIYDRCGGRPLWITEWNNGANWTTESWPTDTNEQFAKQLNDLKGILNVLDTTSFVERYSIYNWVEDKRAIILNGALTPAGEYYKENKSQIAYNGKHYITPTWKWPKEAPTSTLAFSGNNAVLTIRDTNDDYYKGFSVEKRVNDGEFEVVHTESDLTVQKYTDSIDLENNYVKYRVRSLMRDGTYTAYSSAVEYNVTEPDSVKFGKLTVSNSLWNSVFFNEGYQDHPAIVLGVPTIANGSGLQLAARTKQQTASTRFTVQIIPWSYQTSTVSKEEDLPYLILPTGNYQFGGIKGEAGRVSASSVWRTITFEQAFDTIPMVFVTQANSTKSYATTVRLRNVTSTGFEVRLQKEAGQTGTLSSETVSYVALTKGEGVINGHRIKVGEFDYQYSAASRKITYGDTIANPIFIPQLQTSNDDYTATLRTNIVTDSYCNILKQVERSGTVTTSTIANETIGWILIDPVKTVTNIENATLSQYSVYPNPAVSDLYFRGEDMHNVEVNIYNVYGMLVKHERIQNNTLSIRELPAGTYFIKTAQYGVSKFIKL